MCRLHCRSPPMAEVSALPLEHCLAPDLDTLHAVEGCQLSSKVMQIPRQNDRQSSCPAYDSSHQNTASQSVGTRLRYAQERSLHSEWSAYQAEADKTHAGQALGASTSMRDSSNGDSLNGAIESSQGSIDEPHCQDCNCIRLHFIFDLEASLFWGHSYTVSFSMDVTIPNLLGL